MQKIGLLAITLIISVGFFSCSDSLLNQPATENNVANNTTVYSNSFKKENLQNWTFDYRNNRLVSKVIDGSIGGVIQLSAVYKYRMFHFHKGENNYNSYIVTVNATLIIPPGAFEGTREITLIDDYRTASIYCYPGMTFDKTLYMNLVFTGLDLSERGFTADSVRFGYLEEDGEVDPCVNAGITLDPTRGALRVIRAEIHHFSRYAFCR